MPRLLPEDAALNSRVWKWTMSAAAGAAFAAFAGLIGRWSDDPALGWTLAALAAGVGAAVGALGPGPDEERARAWALGGALAALAAPALLRVIGLTLADAALLENPLGTRSFAFFALGQAALLAAIAAAAWTRAARGSGTVTAAFAFVGAGAAAFSAAKIEPSRLLAGAGLAALAAAAIADKPWRRAAAPLRARAFLAATVVGAGLAWFAPGLLLDVWLVRLYAAYPGGRYLAVADDGARLWTAFRFSNGRGVMLRDGVAQTPDPASVGMALKVLIGQRPSDPARVLLLVRPPDPGMAFAAQTDGADALVEDGSRAQAAMLTALGGGPDWKSSLNRPPDGTKPDLALVFFPQPAGADPDRLAGASALTALWARLADGGVAGLLLPPRTSAGAVDAAASAAAAVFGGVRVADLPGGILVLASYARIETDPRVLLNGLSPAAKLAEIDARPTLADAVRWRAVPSTK